MTSPTLGALRGGRGVRPADGCRGSAALASATSSSSPGARTASPPSTSWATRWGSSRARRASTCMEELEDWERLGVEGHFHARHPWLPYHETLTEQTARLVGAQPLEVVVMNTLTVNLHLMMVSFYRPTRERFKILIEGGAFPSDQYAVASQARFHGFDPARGHPAPGAAPRRGHAAPRGHPRRRSSSTGDEIALVLLGNVNYLTGQAFDMAAITRGRARAGLPRGLRSGPRRRATCGCRCTMTGRTSPCGARTSTSTAARARWAASSSTSAMRDMPALPRFAGWWGHDKATRFQMGPDFVPLPGAEGWQLSNPPILQLAALRASMELFDQADDAGACAPRGTCSPATSSSCSTGCPQGIVRIATPRDVKARGSQLSLRFKREPQAAAARTWWRPERSATSASRTSSAPLPRRCTAASSMSTAS